MHEYRLSRYLSVILWGSLSVLLVVVGAATIFAFRLAVPVEASSASGLWYGTSHIRRELDAKYFTETLDYDVDFWFKVDDRGNVVGHAVMRFGLSADDQKLRAFLTWAHSMGTAAANAPLPEIAALLGTGRTIGDVVGLRIAFDDAMPTRSGQIIGHATGSSIHLQWAEAPQGANYKLYREYPTREVVISAKQAPAVNAWPVDAAVDPTSGFRVATVSDASVRRTNGNVQTAAWWRAIRVGQ